MSKSGFELGRFRWPDEAGAGPSGDAQVTPRFDPAAARREAEAAQRPGPLSAGLQPSTQLLAMTNGALGKLGRKHLPVAVLEEWQASLPAKVAPGGAPGLARELDAALLPLLDGARGELTRAAAAQRAAEDRAAAVGWMNQGARLAAVAPAPLARHVAARLGASDPALGKLFQDKVAYHQVLRDLERDASLDPAADPRLAGVAPEVLADLTADRARLAREQGERRAVEGAVRRVEVSRALAHGMQEASRGLAGPPLSRARLLELYGLSEGATLWQLWQAGQAKVPAYALVRGKSPEQIAAAKAGYGGDLALLARVEQEDAADRRRDPAGYGLSWGMGYRQAYEASADPAERAAILWEAQGAAGIPESERSPWTAEQGWALGERWQAAGEGGAPHQVARARVALLREALQSLPPEQRAAAVAQLERLGLDSEAPGRIRAAAEAIEGGNYAGATLVLGLDLSKASDEASSSRTDTIQVADARGTKWWLPAPFSFEGLQESGEQRARALERLWSLLVGGEGSSLRSDASPQFLEAMARQLRDLAAQRAAPGALMDQMPPEKPEEPRDFDTEEAARIAKGFFGPLVTPADLAPIFANEGFTFEDFASDGVREIFPDSRYELPQITILESRGNEWTQADLSDVGGMLKDSVEKHTGKELNSKKDEWFGARVGNIYRKELYFAGPGNARKGSARSDFSVKVGEYWLHVNTVDTDRFKNPTKRESDSATRIFRAAKEGHVMLCLPKLKPGQSYDRPKLQGLADQLIRDMVQPDWMVRWTEMGLDKGYKLIHR